MLELGDEALVLTHDMLVEGTHFLPGMDPADVAWRLVATNMSDLAAKGAQPIGVLLGYQLGADDARFLEGLDAALRHYGTALLGGDTVSGAGPQSMGLTAIGRATHQPVPSRSGARPGDGLWITGAVGAAMIGFEQLRGGTGPGDGFRRPNALLAEGQALAPLVSAMMDVSDGLLLDAHRLATASQVTLAIDSQAVPIAAPEQRRDEALRWGDDYQLLFTLPAGIIPPIAASRIGEARLLGAAALLLDERPPVGPLGYLHGQ